MKINRSVWLLILTAALLSGGLAGCASSAVKADIPASGGGDAPSEPGSAVGTSGPSETGTPSGIKAPAAESTGTAAAGDTEVRAADDRRDEAPVISSAVPAAPGEAEPEGLLRGADSSTDRDEMFKMVEEFAAGESRPAPAPSSGAPAQSGLKAGYSDDNRQYGYFLRFLEEYGGQVSPLDLNIRERITVKVADSLGNPVPNISLSIQSGRRKLTGKTLADGTWQFNPDDFSRLEKQPAAAEPYRLQVEPGPGYPGQNQTLALDRNGPRTVEVTLGVPRIVPDPVPMDIVFVMDTTGSMGEEIERLKNTIQIIHMNLSALSVAAEIRFGMVLYKDREDEYRTQVIPLTGDLNRFQAQLDRVTASGGGDTPEDLEAAMGDLLKVMEWNPRGIRLAYMITDAPPHLDYASSYTLEDAAREARSRGIRLYGIGTGGLDLQGEVILRQLAQYTSGRYIFLTYGSETGENEGGVQGGVSHHTGTNWNADKLETIIIRFAREELSWLTNTPLTDEDPWFEADKVDTETAGETLASLFGQALEQLLDFSTFPVTRETPLAVLPFLAEPAQRANAEYFTEHFVQAAGTSDRISLAERKDIGQILSELEFQNTGLTGSEQAGEIGELLNARVLVTGNLYARADGFELLLKLVRTETGEVLSVTRAVMARGLGL